MTDRYINLSDAERKPHYVLEPPMGRISRDWIESQRGQQWLQHQILETDQTKCLGSAAEYFKQLCRVLRKAEPNAR